MIDNLPKYEDIPCCQFFSIRSIVTPKMPKLLKNGRNWPYNAKFLPNNAHFRNHSLFKRQFCIRMIIGENMKIFLVACFSLFHRLWRQKCQNCWKIVKIDHIIRNFYPTTRILEIIHCLRVSSVYGWKLVKIWRYSLWPIFLYLIDCDAKNHRSPLRPTKKKEIKRNACHKKGKKRNLENGVYLCRIFQPGWGALEKVPSPHLWRFSKLTPPLEVLRCPPPTKGLQTAPTQFLPKFYILIILFLWN